MNAEACVLCPTSVNSEQNFENIILICYIFCGVVLGILLAICTRGSFTPAYLTTEKELYVQQNTRAHMYGIIAAFNEPF